MTDIGKTFLYLSIEFLRQNLLVFRNSELHLCFRKLMWIPVQTPTRYTRLQHVYVLWLNFILGLNFIFLCFRLIIIHYHNLKQKEMKFKPRIKLNLNIWTRKMI